MIGLTHLPARLRSFPVTVIVGLVGLLLVAGFAVIVQSESTYYQQRVQETRVQAEMLAASVVAALDFGDEAAAQESVDALRVNRQILGAAVYGRDGKRVAGFERLPRTLPAQLDTAPSGGFGGMSALVPVTRGSDRVGNVFLAFEAQPFGRRLVRYALIALVVVMAALVVTVLGLAQAALSRANRELETRAAALSIANTELTHEAEERAKAEEQLRQAQKMQALGQLTGGIAHDFNNLLTVIQGSADMLSRASLPDDRRRRFAEAILQASARAAALTSQLLAFARRQPLKPEVIDVNAMVRGMTELLDRTLGERYAIDTLLADGRCTVEADRAQLASALLNIAVNARDAMPDGGVIHVFTQRQSEDGRELVSLSVQDAGQGMDEETRARAMEPFFTTKGTGKGTGLGLSQVYGFASQSGGELVIDSAPGRGATVSIVLPYSAAPLPRSESSAAEARTGRTGSVLLVEDNEEVGEFAETLLHELGHEVTRVISASEALEAIAARSFDVVFTDVVMPVMSGLELADALARIRPGLPVVLTTGFSDELTRSGAGGRPVVLKPYRIESLAKVLEEALEKTPA